ncbi:MAG: glutathione S-transferase family protein [Burkholderiaceae bacterium]|nr:glutathione S-transferase family protein [Sulfuritalea sp.]MCF8175604.1 glutathione S-transferase family protein [Burkholderiaceae bacterium]
MMKLYYGPGACSFVPHVTLEVIKAATGEDFEAQAVKLHKGEQKTPEYLAMNPLGLVPVLVEDGKPLTQIVAICDYLERRFPQAGLLPTDPWLRAQAMSTFAWMNNTVHPTFTHIYRPANFASGEAAQADVRQVGLDVFRSHLERIQGMAQKAAPFLFGDTPSFVDAYALVFLRWGGLVGIDPAGLPAYKAYVERLAAAPAVAAAIAREGIALETYKPK